MIWSKTLSTVEYMFIYMFAGIYIIYLVRTFWIAYKLQTTARSVIVKFILRSIYFGLLILGLLGPSFGVTEREAQATGKDIYFAIDVSKSMDANDIEPSRLEKFKFELINNLHILKSNRIGLIIFSSDAFVHSPLTFDQEAIKLFIQRLNSNLIAESGTNLNSAFEIINQKFIKNATSAKKAKVIALITDGEDFGDLNPKNIQEFKRNQINLMVLGVGTREGGKIKTNDGFKKDDNGNEIITRLDAVFLKKLVTSLGGQYFELSQQRNQVIDILKAINNIENRLIDTRMFTVQNNKYYYFLILALVLLVVDILVTVRTIKL
ncbi:MAG: VWA domain-containing protein [Spirosomaceae bacterium]|nr:VWA domain-containing protein [Spirosomataceae bacterium]